MKVITVKTLADRLGYSEQHIRKLIKDGAIKAQRSGKRRLVVTEAEARRFSETPRAKKKSIKTPTSKAMEEKMDELVKNSDYIISTPDTIEQLQKKGLPIKSKFQTYQEYLDQLFSERRKQASELVEHLPRLDKSIANSTVTSLYEELKECFVMGLPGPSIVMAIILLDISCKFRLHEERLKENVNASWKPLEDLQLGELISELRSHDAITEEEKVELLEFNKKIRNNYLHYNIQKLIKGMVLEELPSVNIHTGEVKVERNVNPADRPFLWFSAKRVLDKQTFIPKVSFCISWSNKLLKEAI